MSDFFTRRGRTWHFVRRAPRVYAQVDRRRIVRQSTGVNVASDRTGRRAQVIADKFNEELLSLFALARSLDLEAMLVPRKLVPAVETIVKGDPATAHRGFKR